MRDGHGGVVGMFCTTIDATEEVRSERRTAPPWIRFNPVYAENTAVGNAQLDAGMQILTKPFVVITLAGKVESLLHS